jgi:Carboxypeptidase regulatory-like domain
MNTERVSRGFFTRANWKKTWLAILLVPSAAAAQCCPGDMHGRITDSAGRPIAGAEVSIHDCNESQDAPSKSERFQDVSKPDGTYRIPHTPWGPCTISVSAKGFSTVVLEHQTFAIDSNREFSQKLTKTARQEQK